MCLAVSSRVQIAGRFGLGSARARRCIRYELIIGGSELEYISIFFLPLRIGD